MSDRQLIDPATAALRNAPLDDEAETDEERAAVSTRPPLHLNVMTAKVFRRQRMCAGWRFN